MTNDRFNDKGVASVEQIPKASNGIDADTLDGKHANEFASVNHKHFVMNIPDTRNIATKPQDYAFSIKPNFKQNSVINNPDNSKYSHVVGIWGWGADMSGGKAHELAFTGNGNMYHRVAKDSDNWEAWKQITTTDCTCGTSESVPIGAIVMWSGSIAAIPVKWALCDGANGTPDLRSRFIVGAGTDSGQDYVPGVNNSAGAGYYHPRDVGGEDMHQLRSAEMPSHNHGMKGQGTVEGGSGGSWNVSVGEANRTTDAGGDFAHENRPPYYALAYIMRIA